MIVTACDLLALGMDACDRFHVLNVQPILVRTKPDGTAVTRVDTEIDLFLRARLIRVVPDAGWLSEESGADPDRLTRSCCWVVDPLDGTKEFARGIPECAISVALVHHGVAVAAVVVNPFNGLAAACGTDGTWIASGEGSSRPRAASLMTAGASVSRTEVEDGSITPFLERVGTARPIGSVAYKLLRVAVGLDDLTFSVQPKSEWDICGGVALLAAQGLAFERLDGRTQVFNQAATRIPVGFVAGPPHLARELASQLRSALPTEGAS